MTLLVISVAFFFAQSSYWVSRSVFALFSGPFIPPIIASVISSPSIRGIAEAVTEAFLAPFFTQMIVSLVVVAVLALAVRFWRVVPAGWNALVGAVKSHTPSRLVYTTLMV